MSALFTVFEHGEAVPGAAILAASADAARSAYVAANPGWFYGLDADASWDEAFNCFGARVVQLAVTDPDFRGL